MKVSDLISLLQKQHPGSDVVLAVGWADDTAISDRGGDVQALVGEDGTLRLEGWMSNTSGDLTVGPPDED